MVVLLFRIINTLARVGILIVLAYYADAAYSNLKDYHEARVILEIEQMRILRESKCPSDFYEFPEKEETS